jgi:hypothetical protein
MADERNMFERRFSQFMEGLNKYGRYTPEGLNPIWRYPCVPS